MAHSNKTLARDSKKSRLPGTIGTSAPVTRFRRGPGEIVGLLALFGGLALPFASETNARKNSNQCDALAQPR